MKKLLPALLLGTACFAAGAFVARPTAPDEITVPMLRTAQQLFGLNFSDAQLDSTRRNLSGYRDSYEALRKVELPNSVAPAVGFDPRPLRLRQAQLRSILPAVGNSIKWMRCAATMLRRALHDVSTCSGQQRFR